MATQAFHLVSNFQIDHDKHKQAYIVIISMHLVGVAVQADGNNCGYHALMNTRTMAASALPEHPGARDDVWPAGVVDPHCNP